MVRRKVEVRREEILDAAAAEVTRRGFARTRVADVASALGVSTALVFYHFGTKEKLFAAALEHAVNQDLERLDSTVEKAKGPADAVRRILALYSPQGSAEGWTVWVDAWAESLREPEMRATSRRLDVRWKDVLAEQIQLGVAEGVFDCPDPDAAAWRLSALLDGLAVQVLVHRSLTRTQLATWVREAAARELGCEPDVLA
ncbi:MAG: TetR family transcriptional regulator [Actinobacteria bacterium]|nr:TetR family transcriptional regulator [Actinomycetota bacterium]